MNYAITMLISLIVAFISTPFVKRLAFQIGAVDIPKDERRMHKKPIALLGGFAIIIGFIAALLYNIVIDEIVPDYMILGMAAGIFILLVCGFLDDCYTINWKIKALFQLAAAVVYILISDVRIDFFTNPFMPGTTISLNPIVAFTLTVLWIVGMTNAINFIDGLDGLAAGVSSISSLSLFFVSVWGIGAGFDSGSAPMLMAALAGAAIGFLPFNFNPAKIFMGETGAAFLGFTLSVVSIQGLLKSYAMISIAIPILIVGLPIFDVAFSIVRRIARGNSPAKADHSHLHHKLIGMGLSQKQSVVLLYITSAVLGVCGFVFANKNYISAVVLLVLLPVFIFACAKFFVGENNSVESTSKDFSNISDIRDISSISNISDLDTGVTDKHHSGDEDAGDSGSFSSTAYKDRRTDSATADKDKDNLLKATIKASMREYVSERKA